MDRFPRGSPRPSRWIGWRPTRGAAWLMGIEGGVYIALALLLGSPRWLVDLALVPEKALGPAPWQLITSGLVHGDLRSLIFDVIGIWFIGSAVEQQVGTRRMVSAFALGQFAGALGAALAARAFGIGAGLAIAGCAFGISGLLAALAVACWSLPLSLFGARPVRGRWIALALVAITLVELLWQAAWVHLAGTLVALGAGALVLSGLELPRNLRGLRDDWNRFRIWRLRRRYKVIQGGRDQRRYIH